MSDSSWLCSKGVFTVFPPTLLPVAALAEADISAAAGRNANGAFRSPKPTLRDTRGLQHTAASAFRKSRTVGKIDNQYARFGNVVANLRTSRLQMLTMRHTP